MQEKQGLLPQETAEHNAKTKAWATPILTKLKVEDAESGINVSENGATGS